MSAQLVSNRAEQAVSVRRDADAVHYRAAGDDDRTAQGRRRHCWGEGVEWGGGVMALALQGGKALSLGAPITCRGGVALKEEAAAEQRRAFNADTDTGCAV